MSNSIQIVWFKRDLRLRDHAPLYEAAQRGAVLPLYIIEPSVIHAADFDPCHWTFLRVSLQELRDSLARLGQPLILRTGEAVDIFESLRQTLTIAGIWAHEETGNGITYARDRAVRRWAKAHGIPLTEVPQAGVVRRLKTRDGWAEAWEAAMRLPEAPPLTHLTPLEGIDLGALPTHAALRLDEDMRVAAQVGGEAAAHGLLDSFLHARSTWYYRSMSSPLSAERACSRLSPHLAFGTISPKTVVQTARQHAAVVRAEGENAPLLRSLQAFDERLHWRSHFIQKLEDEPRIEYESIVRQYDELRPQVNRAYLDAWIHGQTGYPLIDACMRSLMHTGWLNFRMRAMIVSFAAHDLWLPWQVLATARPCVWLDYEPGIHICQFQMQSGSNGNRTLRIYNPTKQAQDHDPQGVFIRRYVPELVRVPDSFVHAPWLMPTEMQRKSGCVIGKHYPAPIVDHETAYRAARAKTGELRRRPDVITETESIMQRHGSRRPVPRRAAPPRPKPEMRQLGLWDEG
jgi:deoxyribodipyrimidine photo-lyase